MIIGSYRPISENSIIGNESLVVEPCSGVSSHEGVGEEDVSVLGGVVLEKQAGGVDVG